MAQKGLSIQEAERLSYYDFMGHLGVPFFQIGGLSSTERLAELCGIGSESRVLEVGCGTGFSACHLAKRFGCRVVGVDIAEEAVKKAGERAAREGLEGSVEFRVGDAYALPFEGGSFDVVLTQFVSQFLDMGRALKEFKRVLKRGGRVGINEMFKDEGLPENAAEKILGAERTIAEITGLPFKIHTSGHWRGLLEGADLKEVETRESRAPVKLGSAPELIREMGGWREFLKLMAGMTRYMLLSRKIRERFGKLSSTKRVLVGSPFFKTSTSRHVGYVLAVGKKG